MSEMLRMGKKSADMLGQSQFVETRVVEPQSFTQQSVRFNLPKSGILDNNCYVTLSMTASDANQNFNLFSGISSVIETATLYFENKVIVSYSENLKPIFIPSIFISTFKVFVNIFHLLSFISLFPFSFSFDFFLNFDFEFLFQF